MSITRVAAQFREEGYALAENADRGEWAVRDGVSVPLGPTPQLCKFEGLYDTPDPHYVDDKWHASDKREKRPDPH